MVKMPASVKSVILYSHRFSPVDRERESRRSPRLRCADCSWPCATPAHRSLVPLRHQSLLSFDIRLRPFDEQRCVVHPGWHVEESLRGLYDGLVRGTLITRIHDRAFRRRLLTYALWSTMFVEAIGPRHPDEWLG